VLIHRGSLAEGVEQMVSVMDEWVGAEAAGPHVAGYRLEQQFGQGTLGAVFRAVDEKRGQPVVVKIIGPPVAADQVFVARLLRETRLAAEVGEPHILPVLQAGQADGYLFVAMPLIAGPDARSLVRWKGALPVERAMSIVWQVASALDAAHAAGLVHGDVKPANILVHTPPGGPDLALLSDFGQGRGPAPGPMLAGTTQAYEALDCIAPEQLEGGEADGRADQYALACVAFELLTGVPPFGGDESGATVPPSMRLAPRAAWVRPGLPPEVDPVLARALEPEPALRYASCRVFASDLQRAFWPGDRLEAPDTGAPAAYAGPADPAPAGQRPSRPAASGPALTAGPEVSVRPEATARPAKASRPGRSERPAATARPVATVTDPPPPGSEPWLVPRPQRRRRRVSPIALAGVAVVAVAGLVTGLIVFSGRPAPPKPKPKPLTFSIAAQSAMPPKNGLVWTRYGDPNRDTAQINGDVTNVTRGEIAQLYAQQFPFRSAPSPAGPPLSLQPAGRQKAASYSFRVVPTLATRYRVEVFQSRSARRPVASSRPTTVYVDGGWVALQGAVDCGRPVCHERLVGEVLVPPSALSTEMAKPVQVYFGMTQAGSGVAPSPPTFHLGGGDAHVTVKPLASNGYEEIITFTFPVGGTGDYNWLWNACVTDTVGEDGMGLPGPNLCGDQTVQAGFTYLGFS
jgi:Protein kinase domain